MLNPKGLRGRDKGRVSRVPLKVLKKINTTGTVRKENRKQGGAFQATATKESLTW